MSDMPYVLGFDPARRIYGVFFQHLLYGDLITHDEWVTFSGELEAIEAADCSRCISQTRRCGACSRSARTRMAALWLRVDAASRRGPPPELELV